MKYLERLARWFGLDADSRPNPQRVQIRQALEEGRRYKRQGDHALALSSLDRAVELAQHLSDTPAMGILHLHRADLFIRQHDWRSAQDLLDRLLQDARDTANPTQEAYTLTGFGTMAQARGEWQAAREFYEQAIDVARQVKSHGAEGRALGHLADTYLHEGNASYAIYLFQEGLPHMQLSGDIEMSSYFVGRLAEAQIASGNRQEGYNLLGQALRLAQQLQFRQYETQWRVALGHYATVEERYADAFLHYQKALAFVHPDTPERFAILRDMGIVCLYLDRPDEALDYAQKAHALQPHDPRANGVLGMALKALTRHTLALPHLQMATQTDASPPLDVVRALAFVQDATGDTDGAGATYQQALTRAIAHDHPLEIARSHRDMALWHSRHHRLPDAIKAFTGALDYYERHGHGTHAQIARLYCDIARLREFVGQGQRAMKDYQQALMHLSSADDLDTRGVVLSNTAHAYLDAGEIESAESFFNEAVHIAQKRNDAGAEALRLGNFGWFLLMTGRPERAIDALDYALQQSQRLELAVNIVVQMTNIGQAYHDTGDAARGLDYQQQAMTQLPALDDTIPLVREHWRALVRVNLANQLMYMGESGQEPESLLAQALDIGQRYQDYIAHLRALTGQGYLHLLRDDNAGAIPLLQEALTMARRAGNQRLAWVPLWYLSRATAAIGEDAQAQAHWKDAQKLMRAFRPSQADQPPAWL